MKERTRIFLVHILFFIFSIWPLGIWFGVLIGNLTYCRFNECSGYNDGWLLPFWILGVVLLNLGFYFIYKKIYNKTLVK